MPPKILKKKLEKEVIQNLLITDAGSEGKAVAKHNGMVVFIPFGAPGDVVDVELVYKRRQYAEGRILQIHSPSPFRTEPFCSHFGLCGGCRWQHLNYRQQLSAKQKHVADNIERIGKVKNFNISPIIPSEIDTFYRNKLEFTFADRRWLTKEEILSEIDYSDQRSLGFHIPDRFDKIIDIDTCYLQPEPSNEIRNFTRNFALQHNLEFFNLRDKKGFFRNLIIRNNSLSQFMVILVVSEHNVELLKEYAKQLLASFSEVVSVFAAINNKLNDSLDDVEVIHLIGDEFLKEKMDDFTFRITPLSFFQTNSRQALNLYKTAIAMLDFSGNETVYDLYTGTATIAAFLSKKVSKVIGIEYSKSAVEDGRYNLSNNNINNVELYHGDIAKILDFRFAKRKGFPDYIFIDPPRSGMMPQVLQSILEILPAEIVYISCNPATQARDIAELSSHYDIIQIQPVDMFPHTHHVENIIHLKKK